MRKFNMFFLSGIFYSIFCFSLATVSWAGEKYAHSVQPLDWGRNPFVLKESSEKMESGLTLSGILWDQISPHAIVNNMVVGIGEKVENYTITDIRQDRVILSDGAETRELTME